MEPNIACPRCGQSVPESKMRNSSHFIQDCSNTRRMSLEEKEDKRLLADDLSRNVAGMLFPTLMYDDYDVVYRAIMTVLERHLEIVDDFEVLMHGLEALS